MVHQYQQRVHSVDFSHVAPYLDLSPGGYPLEQLLLVRTPRELSARDLLGTRSEHVQPTVFLSRSSQHLPMHYALQIEEILFNIFDFCRTRHERAHLTVLARTCRTFKEPALDRIWADLEDDLTPLVRCLPEEMWTENKLERSGATSVFYSLKKPLGQAEWDIILGYSRRIHALISLSGSLGLTADCIEALSKPPITGSIFPKLRTVALHEPHPAVGSLVRHFAHSGVTDISLRNTEILGTAIDAFGSECPFVTNFDSSQSTDAGAFSSLTRRWKNLRYIYSGNSLSFDAVSHLSRLHKLVDMSFEVNDTTVDQVRATQSLTASLTFPVLRRVSLRSTSLTAIWWLVRHVRIPMIENFSAILLARPTVTDLMSFFVSPQEYCGHNSLQFLSLVVDRDHYAAIPTPPLFNLTFDRLRPLTVFENITFIKLDIPCGMDLSEREFLTLVSSWPRLQSFMVAWNYDWTPSSALTLEGFLQLLERCRSLQSLYFMLDTRGYTDILQGDPWRGRRMPINTYINLLNSPIEEESVDALSVFFHVAPYPYFHLATHWHNTFFEGSRRPRKLCYAYHDRWERVGKLARDLWEERRDLRHSLEARSEQHPSQ